jgi:hypothetical protein
MYLGGILFMFIKNLKNVVLLGATALALMLAVGVSADTGKPTVTLVNNYGEDLKLYIKETQWVPNFDKTMTIRSGEKISSTLEKSGNECNINSGYSNPSTYIEVYTKENLPKPSAFFGLGLVCLQNKDQTFQAILEKVYISGYSCKKPLNYSWYWEDEQHQHAIITFKKSKI